MSKITLSMIVKNEEHSLRRCLNSVRDIVDEIVIVDTGSRDKTLSIAQEFNAKIFNILWVEDFSAARNYALKKSTGNFILYLDADEELKENSKKELLKLSNSTDKIGYYCTVKSIDEFSKQNNTIRYIRFFKNSENIKFIGRVHEQITDSLIENKYKLLHSKIEIIHYGYNIPDEEKLLKAQRNLKLLQKEYHINKSPYVAFQIGQSFFILKNFNGAEEFFRVALNSNSLSKDLQSESYYYLAQISHNRFDTANAELNILNALKLNDKKPFHHYLYAKILQRKQEFLKSLNAHKIALELHKQQNKIQKENLQTVFLNTTEVIFSAINIALNSNERNYLNYFINELRNEINSKFIQYKNHYEILIKILLNNNNLSDNAPKEILQIVNKENLDTIMLLGDRITDYHLKVSLLESILEKFPDENEVIKKLAICYDANNTTDKSISLLHSKYQIIEKDVSSLLYLSSFYIKKNLLKEALEIFNTIDKNFPNIYILNPKVGEIKERIKKAMNN